MWNLVPSSVFNLSANVMSKHVCIGNRAATTLTVGLSNAISRTRASSNTQLICASHSAHHHHMAKVATQVRIGRSRYVCTNTRAAPVQTISQPKRSICRTKICDTLTGIGMCMSISMVKQHPSVRHASSMSYSTWRKERRKRVAQRKENRQTDEWFEWIDDNPRMLYFFDRKKNREYFIVGTAHISNKSAEEVRTV
jgi:hypothetical protein